MTIRHPLPQGVAKFAWVNGRFTLTRDCVVHPLANAAQYGQSCFEGIRCYKTKDGFAVFRLREHIERLMRSAAALGMKLDYTVEDLMAAIIKLLKRNKMREAYIRPWIAYDAKTLGVNPKDSPVTVMIFCWQWGNYYAGKMLELVTSKVRRLSPESFDPEAKIGGHYVNSWNCIQADEHDGKTGLMLDSHGNIAELAASNIFFVVGNELWTPRRGSILPGITRDSVIKLARDCGYKVRERRIRPVDLRAARKRGHLLEAFTTGTAAEITAVRSLDGKVFGDGKLGPVTRAFSEYFRRIVTGQMSQYESWLARG